MISVVIASTWMNIGGATLIYLAALQNIPGELYEAAEIDGAGLFRKITSVVLGSVSARCSQRCMKGPPSGRKIASSVKVFAPVSGFSARIGCRKPRRNIQRSGRATPISASI